MMIRPLIALALVGAVLALPSAASAAPPLDPKDPLPTCTIDEGQTAPTDCRVVMRNAPLAPRSYVGWTYLDLNHCDEGSACIAMIVASTTAWRWTGRAWSRSWLREGWVYVSPYTGRWRWAWTRETGWVASDHTRFELRRW